MAKKKKKSKKKTRKKTKVKAKKIKKVRTVIKKRSKGKRKAALVLSVIAMIFLVVYAVYIFVAKDQILDQIQQSLADYPEAAAMFGSISTILFAIALIWLVLAVINIFTLYALEHKKKVWYILLIVGIVSILSGRLVSGALNIISSILYIRNR